MSKKCLEHGTTLVTITKTCIQCSGDGIDFDEMGFREKCYRCGGEGEESWEDCETCILMEEESLSQTD